MINFVKKRKKTTIVILIILSLIVIRGFSKEEEIIPETYNVAVETTEAKIGNINQYIVVSGEIQDKNKVDVYPEYQGAYKVSQILVSEGQYVKKGQSLAALDNSTSRLQYEQALVDFQDIQENYDRNKQLFDKGFVSKVEFDKIESSYQKMEKSISMKEIELNKTYLKAPISGRISDMDLKKGELVGAQKKVATIAGSNDFQVEFYVNEKRVDDLNVGQEVNMKLDETTILTGKIYFISDIVDPKEKAYLVKAVINEENDRIRDGKYIEVECSTRNRENIVLLDKKAVLRKENTTYVFIVSNDKLVAEREVVLGIDNSKNVEIVSGLNEGDVVVTTGKDDLVSGMFVDVVKGGQE